MDYKPNSHRFKREQAEKEAAEKERKVNKVISGGAKTKKKSEVRKFADVFVPEDTAKVKNHILMDVLVPAIKNMISESIKTGIDMILYGDVDTRRKTNSPASKISYGKFYDSPVYRSNSVTTASRYTTYDYSDIILDSRGDAEAVLMGMDEIMSKYELVRVADMYDLVGITGSYTDNNYGWTDIRSARIERVREGYIIRMPKPLPID